MPTTSPGAILQVDVAQHEGRRRAGLTGEAGLALIAERNIVEGDGSPDRVRLCTVMFRFGPGVHDITEACNGDPDLLPLGPDRGQLQDRLADTAGNHVDRDERSDRQLAVEDQHHAVDEYGKHSHLVDEPHRLADGVGIGGQSEMRQARLCDMILPAVALLRLNRHAFDDLDRRNGFDQERVNPRAILKILFDPAPQRWRGDHWRARTEPATAPPRSGSG